MEICLHGFELRPGNQMIVILDNQKFQAKIEKVQNEFSFITNIKHDKYHQGIVHIKVGELVYSSDTFIFKHPLSNKITIKPHFESKEMNVYFNYDVEFGDNIAIVFNMAHPLLQDSSQTVSLIEEKKEYPMFYGTNKWSFIATPFISKIENPITASFVITKKTGDKINLPTNLPIGLKNNYLTCDKKLPSITMEDERKMYDNHLRQRDKKIDDAMVWKAVNWFQQNSAKLLPTPSTIINKECVLTPFNPDVCHRKMYLVDGLDGKKYIFSPMIEADNKWTPLYEIINYKLAQYLKVPSAFYIPETFEGCIPGKGIGSLKVFITIKDKNVYLNNIRNKKDLAWIIVYDYLISNIERNWNDHLCLDSFGKLCLLDNDLGVHRQAESILPNQETINNLPAETKEQIKKLNISSFDAPYHWVEIVEPRLQALRSKIK